MSISHLFKGQKPTFDIDVKSLTVVPKTTCSVNWNPANTASVPCEGSNCSLAITLNTTALAVGLVSSKLTVTNSSILSTSNILVHLVNYSGLPSSYDGTTSCPDPICFVSGIRDGAFDFQILSNGYAGMGATDTMTLIISIT
jgi:hypothetical protein